MDNKENILIIKNQSAIMISYNGKKMIIDKSNLLFKQLNNKSKDKIKEWYINR